MSDYLFAIKANRDTCKPYSGPGWVGHVVLVTTRSAPTIINEFTTFPANLSHVACAPSAFQSWLLDETEVRTTIERIEQLAHTGPTGTKFTGIEAAATWFKQGFKPSSVAPSGTIMNPGGGYIDPISDFPAYLACRQGGLDCLQLIPAAVPAPQPSPAPVPVPAPPLEDDMAFLATAGTRPASIGQDPNGQGAIYLCDGIFKRHLPGAEGAALPQFEAAYGPVRNFSAMPYVLDRMIELPDLGPLYINVSPATFVKRTKPTPDPD